MDTYLPPRDNEKLSPTTKRDVLWNAGGSTIRDDFARSASEAADVYRRRSPAPPDRRSRQRNRSRSPLAIDRYQPEPRFSRDDFYNGSRDRDERRRGPSPAPSNIDRYVPGQDSPVPQPTMNLQDPNKIDSQVGFSYFWEWWRLNEKTKEEKKNVGRRQVDRVKGDRESREDREREKVQIQLAYDVYKEGLQCRMSRSFVNSHKGEEWFKEKYVAEFRDPFRQKLNEYRHGLYMQFESDLESGCFDEFTLEGIPKSESNGAGGILEKEEGETTATAEVLGVGDLVTLRGGDIRDEGAYQPALLIKTIAPNVCRAKLEEYSKEHLGDGPGGFKWLSLSDPNPSKRFHRIGWIMLNPEGDTQQSNERGDGREEDANSVSSNTAAGTTLSSAEKALKAIDGKTVYDEVRGDFTCHVGVHVPPSDPRKKALWDLFSSPDRIERDLQLVKKLVAKFEQEIGSDVNGLARIEQRVSDLNIQGLLQTVPQLPAGAKNSKKTDSDMEAHEIEEGENDPDDELEEGEDEEDIDDDEMLVKKKTLDLCVEYLRRVFNFCFFCVLEGDSVHELARKCPGGHLRRPRACLSMAAKAAATASACGESFPGKLKNQASDEGIEASPIADSKFSRTGSKSEQQLQRAFNWVKTFEDKILQILEPENVNIGKLGGKPIINALEEELRKFMKQEDPNKYRCKVLDCTKLFKAEVFWRKHVEKRHPDWFETVKQDASQPIHFDDLLANV
ncbi:MAG: hypothetical protein M1829_002455 [Trizodia sp. TS-e1964]|nr:MAG: hypothetical protein M1829_002455 [Trizodia sp. TS-e1964]